jgi:hypothetical protein
MKTKLVLVLAIVFLAFAAVQASDIYPNYIKGTVFASSGVPAPSGTVVTVVVTSGEYKGYEMQVTVDGSNVPPFLHGRGYYYTKDDIHFNTGDNFEVIVDNGAYYGSASGTFFSFGNGAFNSTEINVLLNQHQKTEPSGSGGSGGSGGNGGYNASYNYVVPKPASINTTELIEQNAPLVVTRELSPEMVAFYKEVYERQNPTETSPYQILAILLMVFVVYTVIFIFFKKSKRSKRGK